MQIDFMDVVSFLCANVGRTIFVFGSYTKLKKNGCSFITIFIIFDKTLSKISVFQVSYFC